jgi:hypothetical protein
VIRLLGEFSQLEKQSRVSLAQQGTALDSYTMGRAAVFGEDKYVYMAFVSSNSMSVVFLGYSHWLMRRCVW